MVSKSSTFPVVRAGIAAVAAFIVPLTSFAAPAGAFPDSIFAQISLVSSLLDEEEVHASRMSRFASSARDGHVVAGTRERASEIGGFVAYH